MFVSANRIPAGSAFHAVVWTSLYRRHYCLDYCDVVNLYFSMWGMPGRYRQFRNLLNQATYSGDYVVYSLYTMLISNKLALRQMVPFFLEMFLPFRAKCH